MKWIEKILDVKPYVVKTMWNDGVIRWVDLDDLISSKSLNPESSYSKIKNIEVFCSVKCDGTSLYWENMIKFKDEDGTFKDGNLDIAPELLYELASLELKQVV